MALKIGDLFEDFGPAGIAAGIGAVILLPVVAGLGKPLAKAAIKGGIAVYEKSKGVLAEAGEVFEDLVAEAKAELADEETNGHIAALKPLTIASLRCTKGEQTIPSFPGNSIIGII